MQIFPAIHRYILVTIIAPRNSDPSADFGGIRGVRRLHSLFTYRNDLTKMVFIYSYMYVTIWFQ